MRLFKGPSIFSLPFDNIYKNTNITDFAFLPDYYEQNGIVYDFYGDTVSNESIFLKSESGTIPVSYYIEPNTSYIQLKTFASKYNTIEKIRSYNSSFDRVYTKIFNENRLLKETYIKNDVRKYFFYKNSKNIFTKVNVYSGLKNVGDYITVKEGNLAYSRFSDNSPTWCNQFVFNLTEHIYKENLVPDPGNTNANKLNIYLNAHPDYFVEIIEKQNKKLIWEYINKGYPVIFSSYNTSGSGHVEFGFPDGVKTMNVRNFYKKEDATPKITYNHRISTKNIKITVGAGSYIGYKYANIDKEKKNFYSESQKFIYLKYLFKHY